MSYSKKIAYLICSVISIQSYASERHSDSINTDPQQFYFTALETAKLAFDQTTIQTEQYCTITQRMEHTPDRNYVEKNPHILSIAICAGDAEAVETFLSVIPDVNDSNLDVWGYRQSYTLAHIALKPCW